MIKVLFSFQFFFRFLVAEEWPIYPQGVSPLVLELHHRPHSRASQDGSVSWRRLLLLPWGGWGRNAVVEVLRSRRSALEHSSGPKLPTASVQELLRWAAGTNNNKKRRRKALLASSSLWCKQRSLCSAQPERSLGPWLPCRHIRGLWSFAD